MMLERLIKILASGALAILCALIAIGNIQDPASNMAFVQHVLSMDYLPTGSPLAERALPVPLLWQVVFWVIVAMEVLTAALFALGTLELVRARKSRAWDFQAAKRFVYLGAGSGFLVWFVGFTGFGAEWFVMWQSPAWNGQQAAFRLVALIFLALIFIAQPDAELQMKD
jgi:predicted small integral membrane protein